MTAQYLELATKVGEGSAKLEDFDDIRNAAADASADKFIEVNRAVGQIVAHFKDKSLTVEEVLELGAVLPEKRTEKVAEKPVKEPTKAEVKAYESKSVSALDLG